MQLRDSKKFEMTQRGLFYFSFLGTDLLLNLAYTPCLQPVSYRWKKELSLERYFREFSA